VRETTRSIVLVEVRLTSQLKLRVYRFDLPEEDSGGSSCPLGVMVALVDRGATAYGFDGITYHGVRHGAGLLLAAGSRPRARRCDPELSLGRDAWQGRTRL
jgi:hypothetical protein